MLLKVSSETHASLNSSQTRLVVLNTVTKLVPPHKHVASSFEKSLQECAWPATAWKPGALRGQPFSWPVGWWRPAAA